MSFHVQGILMIALWAVVLLLSISVSSHHSTDFDFYSEDKDSYPGTAFLQDLIRENEVKHDTSELKIAKKRALSILTRWRSLGSGVGRRTNALSKVPRAPMSLMQGDVEGVSKEIRRVGAPLRWGR